MKQPCWVLAIRSRFPHELTTLPSASNSITGGAGVAKFLSLGAISPLVTANTWSRASTHTLPTDPSTHPSGNGLGFDLGGQPTPNSKRDGKQYSDQDPAGPRSNRHLLTPLRWNLPRRYLV